MTEGRRWPPLRAVALILLGAVFGAGMTLAWTSGPTTRSVRGTVTQVDQTASAIVMGNVEGLGDTAFGVVGVLWQRADGDWQRGLSPEGHPTCISPEDEGMVVELGLVAAPGGLGRPSSEVVAWLRCVSGSD